MNLQVGRHFQGISRSSRSRRAGIAEFERNRLLNLVHRLRFGDRRHAGEAAHEARPHCDAVEPRDAADIGCCRSLPRFPGHLICSDDRCGKESVDACTAPLPSSVVERSSWLASRVPRWPRSRRIWGSASPACAGGCPKTMSTPAVRKVCPAVSVKRWPGCVGRTGGWRWRSRSSSARRRTSPGRTCSQNRVPAGPRARRRRSNEVDVTVACRVLKVSRLGYYD